MLSVVSMNAVSSRASLWSMWGAKPSSSRKVQAISLSLIDPPGKFDAARS